MMEMIRSIPLMSQCGPRRQAKPAVEDDLGYATADDSGGTGLFVLIVVFGVAAVDPEYGLEMHKLPDGTGFDVFFFKGKADGFAVRAKGVRGDEDDGQPAVGGSVGGFGTAFVASSFKKRPWDDISYPAGMSSFFVASQNPDTMNPSSVMGMWVSHS